MTSSPSLSTDALPPATMAGGWTPKGSPVTGGHMPKVAGPRRQPGENSGALFEEYSPGTDTGTRPGGDRLRWHDFIAGNRRQAPQSAVNADQPALDHLAQVLEQVPPVTDLDRLG